MLTIKIFERGDGTQDTFLLPDHISYAEQSLQERAAYQLVHSTLQFCSEETCGRPFDSFHGEHLCPLHSAGGW